MTNKYVHKKWANNEDWSNDPAWLFENKPKKFEKYVKYYNEKFGGPKEKVSYKNKQSDSDDSDEPVQKKKQGGNASMFQKPAAPSKIIAKKNEPVVDLMNFDAPAAPT